MPAAQSKPSALARYAWGVLAYNVAVVLWGAYVRATGAGAGCGRHWPRCNGRVVPLLRETKELVEFTHRVSSGFALLLVVGLLAWTLRAAPRGHLARRAAVVSMVLMVMEALLGAGLVLLRLVAGDKSSLRAFSMAAHLTNTFLLLAAITLTAWFLSTGARVRTRGRGAVLWPLGIALAATLFVAVSGAVTALGDTLFPATSLTAGLRADMSATAHFLVRLRVVHPALAIATSLYVVFAGWLVRRTRPSALTARLSKALAGLFVAQLLVGAVNVILLAPLAMQIVHLLMADVVWIVLVVTTAAALADDAVLNRPLGRDFVPGDI
ncbi:MAG TPA: COX15/CtaA family protein [Longimicrobiaceae bacterium]|jgi:heme A synthase|nr:COX15/CtaA family protein [Longimicrobiaceae bacterium]